MTNSEDLYTLTDEEQAALPGRILAILKQAKVAGIRITGKDLAARLEQKNDRKIRIVIAELIERGELIAASNHEPQGYFLIETREEADVYEATLRSRARKTLKRLSDFRKSVARKFGTAYQMPLFTIEAALKELER